MVMPAPDAQQLLKIAATAIHRASFGQDPGIFPGLAGESAHLRRNGASFVTLKIAESLRGCIGTLQAARPLAEDVAHNAHAAAVRDPRFPPLRPTELTELHLTVAVLSEPEPLAADDRDHLLQQLRPNIDGLILVAGRKRATFLPAVWEQLPRPEAFLDALWQKAGLRSELWPTGISLARYETENFDAPLCKLLDCLRSVPSPPLHGEA